jgi:hypothetical protein
MLFLLKSNANISMSSGASRKKKKGGEMSYTKLTKDEYCMYTHTAVLPIHAY